MSDCLNDDAPSPPVSPELGKREATGTFTVYLSWADNELVLRAPRSATSAIVACQFFGWPVSPDRSCDVRRDDDRHRLSAALELALELGSDMPGITTSTIRHFAGPGSPEARTPLRTRTCRPHTRTRAAARGATRAPWSSSMSVSKGPPAHSYLAPLSSHVPTQTPALKIKNLT